MQTSCKGGTGLLNLELPLRITSLIFHCWQLLKGCPTRLACRDTAKSSVSTLGTQEISKTLNYHSLHWLPQAHPSGVKDAAVPVPQGMLRLCWFLPWFSSPQLPWSAQTWLCAASPAKAEGQRGRATSGKEDGSPVMPSRLGWHSMELITQQQLLFAGLLSFLPMCFPLDLMSRALTGFTVCWLTESSQKSVFHDQETGEEMKGSGFGEGHWQLLLSQSGGELQVYPLLLGGKTAEGKVSVFPQVIAQIPQNTPAAVRPGVRTSQFHLKIQTLSLDITPNPAPFPEENSKYNHSPISNLIFSTFQQQQQQEVKKIKIFLGNQFLVKFFSLVQNRTSCRGSPCLNSSTSTRLWLRIRTAFLGSQDSGNLSKLHRLCLAWGGLHRGRAAPCTAPCYRGKAACTLTRFAWQEFQRLLLWIRAAGTAYISSSQKLAGWTMQNSLILFICCLLPKRHNAPVASLSFPLPRYQSYICPFEGQTQAGWEQGNQEPLSTLEFGIPVCSKAGKCKGTVPI